MDPKEEQFAFSYQLKMQGDVLEILEIPKFNTDAQRLLTELWKRIWGN